MSKIVHGLLLAALTAWGLFGPIAWIVRDGLGPSAVESHGWEAARQFFWTFYWGPVFALLLAAALLEGRRHRRGTVD